MKNHCSLLSQLTFIIVHFDYLTMTDLYDLCRIGNIYLIREHLKNRYYGTSYLNFGLFGAYKAKNIEIIKLMIDLGATNIDHHFTFPSDKKMIFELIKLGVHYTKFNNMRGYDKFLEQVVIKQIRYNENIIRALDGHLIPDLAKIVGNYCVFEQPKRVYIRKLRQLNYNYDINVDSLLIIIMIILILSFLAGLL